jgi:helicase-like protein
VALVCATDAVGLNLQPFGAQLNVDLPWNPSRLEQRKGRVHRIGQVRDNVHILNLRYAGTVQRFGDIFSVLVQLPDGFEDQWIDAVLQESTSRQKFPPRSSSSRQDFFMPPLQ